LTALLVLFDVDGTLFLTHDPLLGRALRETLSEHFGVELPEDALERVEHEGQTSLRIGRLVLRVSSAQDAGIRSLRVGPRTGLAEALAQLG
jgi:beta-phosphoglucomutase-like phosphatase (HAD superfamily)